jgi:hypothetical protein
MVGDLIGLVVTDALISDDSKMIKLVTNKGYAFIAFTHETYVSKIDNASHIKSTIVDTGRISRFLHFVETDLGMVMIRDTHKRALRNVVVTRDNKRPMEKIRR